MDQSHKNPVHSGELAAQNRAGGSDVSKWAGGFVRDHLPRQHRDFYSSLPFLALSGAAEVGRVWTTTIEGDVSFIRSPNPHSLTMQTEIDANIPLAARFAIDLATRPKPFQRTDQARRKRFVHQDAPDIWKLSAIYPVTFLGAGGACCSADGHNLRPSKQHSNSSNWPGRHDVDRVGIPGRNRSRIDGL